LAIPEAVVHDRALCAFTDVLREENPGHLAEWEQQVRDWEADHINFFPYEIPDESKLPNACSRLFTHSLGAETTTAAVKKRLSEAEHEKATRGCEFIGLGITPSDFIIGGLDLEEQQ